MASRLYSIDQIIKATAETFKVPIEVLIMPTIRTSEVLRARHAAVYLARKLTYRSFEHIAKAFNQRDHSNAWYAFNKASVLIKDDSDFAKDIRTVLNSLEQLPTV